MKRSFSAWFARLYSRWFRKSGAPSADGHAGPPADAHAAHGALPPGAMSHAPMLDCESVMRRLWDYLDGELTPERMSQIREHIAMCKRCYPQYEFERSFLGALAARRRQHSDPERLRTQLMVALQEQGFSEV